MDKPLPPADISRLASVLGNAKNLMKTVESDNYQKGNIDSSMVNQDTSGYIPENRANPNMMQQPQQTMGQNPTRKFTPINESAINNSGMPDEIKKLMLENPIKQPTMNHTFDLEDVSHLIEDKKPAPTPRVNNTNMTAPINEGVMHNKANDTFTVSETVLRGIIKEVLIEYLKADYTKNLTEGVIKKTINTLIREGKIKTRPKK
jgi:hypothetical protein